MSEDSELDLECLGAGCVEHQAAAADYAQIESKCEQPTVDASKWCCEVCTYQNFPASRKCTMCRAAKPSLGEDIFRLHESEGASGTATQMPDTTAFEAGAACIEERLRPLQLSSPPPSPSPPRGSPPPQSQVAKWCCPTCTYENWPKAQKCAMCGASCQPGGAARDEGARGRPGARTKIGINDISNSLREHQAAHEPDTNNRHSKRCNIDWLWLQACIGVVEDSPMCVEAYLSSGGDPARALTPSETALLDRASAFDAGHTLVHLAIRFQREDILATLLSRISGGGSGVKRAPPYIAPDLAAAIRRHVASIVRHKKGSFPCRYLAEFATFSLPPEIEELPVAIQEQLFSELLDQEAQQTLEADPPLINWSLELTVRLGSRLYALWNRSAGDCLLDAVMQASWGVFDSENIMRRALADSLHHAGRSFYERWHAWERLQAAALQYAPEEEQLRAEWTRLVAAAAVPGRALHQMHVFVLAHVMRRPIIVYGVNIVNSYKGEAIGYAGFQGVYLPLLWSPDVCSKSPLCVGYTRGHFSALVPVARYSEGDAAAYICREDNDDAEDVIFLPLTDSEGKLLPVHYLTCDEMCDEETALRTWLCVCVSSSGALVAQRRPHKRRLLVAQLLEEWLNHYRRLAQQTRGPFPPRLHSVPAEYSSDADTDEE